MKNSKKESLSAGLTSLDRQFKRGLDLMETRKYDDAAAIFLSVLKENPAHFLAMEQFGIVAGRLGQHDQAITFLKAVTETAPTYARGYFSLATGLKRVQQFREAGAALDTCLQLGAYDKALVQDTAHLLLELGLKDKAEAAFQQLYEISGTILSMYRILMHEYKVTSADNPFFIELKNLEKNEKKLKTKDEKVILHYLLSKAYNDMKDYDSAFKHMDMGAILKRKDSRYDVSKHLEWLEGMRQYYTPAFLKKHSKIGFITKKPVFIVGMPRCGSTLLDQILCSHKDIKSMGESPALSYLMRNHADMPEHDGIKFPTEPRDTPYPMEKIGEEYLRQMNTHGLKAERIVDKSLINFVYIGIIKILFPHAKVIHCVRDPMDCCLSCYSIAFSGDGHLYTYDLGDLGKFYCGYRKLMDYWHEILPGFVLDVEYENIVNNPEPNIRRVLDFIGMPWEDNCLNFYETDRSVRSASIIQVRKPLYKSSIKKWMKYEEHLGPLIEALGPYAPEKGN